MGRTKQGGLTRRTLLDSTLGLGAAAALGGMLPGRAARADAATLNMWWWGEQELPGLQAYVDDSVRAYTAATVKPMLQDTAVVISQFQTAAAAGQPPDIQFLWNGIYHMESVWLGYLSPLEGVIPDEVIKDSNPTLLSRFGGKTYRLPLPKGIPYHNFWSLMLYDNQTRSMLATPQNHPRAGSQSYPSPAAEANADGSTTVYIGPQQPDGVKRGNWIQTIPGKGWFAILRLYGPLEPFFEKSWRPSEIEVVK